MALTALLPAVSLRAEEHRSKYYDLYYEDVDGPELGRALDALHEQLTRYFGKAPSGRLRLEIYATSKQYELALRRDGQIVAGGGGYYAPGSRTGYLFRQPSAYHTRHLTLHEATHQFHYLVAAGNRSPLANWYIEGLAEYFACHNWDGQKLESGAVPQLTLEDRPAKALKDLDAIHWDLDGVAANRIKVDRPVAWALVHYLIHQPGSRFRLLADRLDRHEDPATAWREVYGRVGPDFVRGFRAWLESHQQAWKIVWIHWQQRGAWLEGSAQTVGLTVLKQTPRQLDVEIQPDRGYLKAGLVFGFKSDADFHLMQVWGDDQVHIVHRRHGKWERVQRFALLKAAGRARLGIRFDGDRATLSANGQELHTLTAPGQVGLSVDNCTARFRILD